MVVAQVERREVGVRRSDVDGLKEECGVKAEEE